ncbi:DUF5703 domain-containing protein [Blautia schinkii]|nr:DUF5703 domain-containing protein [Blautia schinkii]
MDGNKGILKEIAKSNVVYHELGQSDRSSMPIGNGELCASVWVEEEGKIRLYLSRTDALTEFDRTVKLGMAEISLSPNPFLEGEYLQVLCLDKGQITIEGRGAKIVVFADMGQEHLYITGSFECETDVTAEYIAWRTSPSVYVSEYPVKTEVCEAADTVFSSEDQVVFYHKNGKTIIPETARLQEVEEAISVMPDCLENRIFGGVMLLKEGHLKRENVLEKNAAASFELVFITQSMQGEETEFIKDLKEQRNHLEEAGRVRAESQAAWQEYWCRSYLFVSGDRDVDCEAREEIKGLCVETQEYSCACRSQITNAYIWTKYMFACCGKGAFPILYNGMLFNLCPAEDAHFRVDNFGLSFTGKPGEISLSHNPDERSWCVEHLWQNVRHPYHTFLMQGDPDKLRVLFQYYKNFWEINRIRAREYYGAKGQHNTEMTMSFGLQSMGIYGEDRHGLKKGFAKNRHGGAVDISPGLELISLMLDYYEFTKEQRFLEDEILVYTVELLNYIETRFPVRENGKIKLYPLHSVETYHDTENPLPTIAGLYSILGRLSKLDIPDKEIKEYLEGYKEMLPELPTEPGGQGAILKPAEKYSRERQNIEIPELYACFPFRLFTGFKDGKELMKRTFYERTAEHGCDHVFQIGSKPDQPSYSGWQSIGVVAALLWEPETAADILENNCALKNPGSRFPAMWGPIYDAVPDTDHGANIINQLQTMVMQTDGDDIYILPGYPRRWDVKFRLYADKNTVVTCEYKDGILSELHVEPESRIKDVHICMDGQTAKDVHVYSQTHTGEENNGGITF